MPSASHFDQAVQRLTHVLPARALDYLARRAQIDEIRAIHLGINKHTIETRLRAWLLLQEDKTLEEVIRERVLRLVEDRLLTDDPELYEHVQSSMRGSQNPVTVHVRALVEKAILDSEGE